MREVFSGGSLRAEDADLGRAVTDKVLACSLPSHWKTLAAPEGGAYYWNKVTDATTWAHPLAACAAPLLDAARDCGARGAKAGAEARQRRAEEWVQRWQQEACLELSAWRRVDRAAGKPEYFYRASPGPEGSTFASSRPPSPTWQDPRVDLEFRLRFRTEALASLLAAAPPGGAPVGPAATGPPEQAAPRAARRPQLRRAEDGRWFEVEPMPADHSCGFHGLGIGRGRAAALLREHRGDPDVQRFVAADLAATLQTNDRDTFPPDIRGDDALWAALDAYYAAQASLDERCREGRDLLAEDGGAADAGKAGGDVQLAVQRAVQQLFEDLIREAEGLPAGPRKLQVMHRLGLCKAQVRALEAAVAARLEADRSLRGRCQARSDAFVRWVGSDDSFWLSFVRGVGAERTGGLLDALAKVGRLTVRVWSEGPPVSGAGDPDLELLHEAPYGDRVVDLWYQGDLGHFDRLVPPKGARAGS